MTDRAAQRAEETLSYEGRADCLDHAKEHARDVLALLAERVRLRAVVEAAREYRAAEEAFQAVFDFGNRPDENERLALCVRGEAARSRLDAALGEADND